MAIKKVTVNLTEDEVRFLKDLAAKEHLTFTDVLRRSISTEKFFVEQEKNQRKILVEEPGKRLREVIRR